MDSLHLQERLSSDLDGGKTVVLACTCSIEYWGRSRSAIGSGDRLVVFKPDSTIIVHSPSGFKPVNWMSAPTDVSVDATDGKVSIFAQRTVKPFEEIRIKVERVIGYEAYTGLCDRKKLELTHTEHDMRDWLAAHPAEVHPDFRLKSVEYNTPLGFFDLYGKVGDRYAVVELKAVRAGLPAALQLKRYRDWLREQLRQEVVGILMAPGVTANTAALLKKEGLGFKKFNVKQLRIERRGCTLDDWMG
jgi:endonuclease